MPQICETFRDKKGTEHRFRITSFLKLYRNDKGRIRIKQVMFEDANLVEGCGVCGWICPIQNAEFGPCVKWSEEEIASHRKEYAEDIKSDEPEWVFTSDTLEDFRKELEECGVTV